MYITVKKYNNEYLNTDILLNSTTNSSISGTLLLTVSSIG